MSDTHDDDPEDDPKNRAPNPPASEHPDHWKRRVLASFLGLPHVCVVRRCRRKKHCTITQALCLRQHQDLALNRMYVLCGWLEGPADEAECDDADDATF